MLPWISREVLMTESPKKCTVVQEVLRAANIPFRLRLVGSNSTSRRCAQQFYIYVKKEDREEADHLIAKGFRKQSVWDRL
ncbi:MAG: hypothetical protein PHY23_10470 [Oscillospiraceae bacterium]|jgi:hypothetical protein|nr:hypothetical protein [Oscillospiraceae bacterium]